MDTKPIFKLFNWSSFEIINRLCVLSFENNAFRTVHWIYFLQTVKIKGFNVMTDGRNFFDYPVKDDMRK